MNTRNEVNNQLRESLLYEEEGNTLDFKRDQYRFTKASDFEKAELLKDILAFCNAWRRADAFILIGVFEVKGGESTVVGITELLDDAQIQQFVNGKTQRPIDFSYKNISFRDKQIALIRIPVQQRPIYLRQDYGGLKRNVVYIRRGSSTCEANPDEIANMRQADLPSSSPSIPKLVLKFKSPTNGLADWLKVPAYKLQDKANLLSILNSLRIPEEDLVMVKKHQAVLDKIEDRYPDGNAFYPFKADIVTNFSVKTLDAIQMAETDFDKLCGFIDLRSRSTELDESFYSKTLAKTALHQTHTFLNISNEGRCPAEGLILYLASNEKVRFLDLEELLSLSITMYNQIPDYISSIIEKARQLENGVNLPITTMFEKVHGSRNWSSFEALNLNRNAFPKSTTLSSRLLNGEVKITVERDLMHNHDRTVPANGIFLCPFLREGEEADITYVFHARNLPDPQQGRLIVTGIQCI